MARPVTPEWEIAHQRKVQECLDMTQRIDKAIQHIMSPNNTTTPVKYCTPDFLEHWTKIRRNITKIASAVQQDPKGNHEW